MHDEIYTDGLDAIMVGGSIVRVDLVSLSPTERDANNTPKKVFRQRIIMPIDAFANGVELMQQALNGLVEAGAVHRFSDVQKVPRLVPTNGVAGS